VADRTLINRVVTDRECEREQSKVFVSTYRGSCFIALGPNKVDDVMLSWVELQELIRELQKKADRMGDGRADH
jgi:hypothetical protein